MIALEVHQVHTAVHTRLALLSVWTSVQSGRAYVLSSYISGCHDFGKADSGSKHEQR